LPVRAALALGDKGERRPSPAYAVTVLTTTACNLGCSYCFQNVALDSSQPFAPLRIEARHLAEDVAAEIANFVQDQMRRQSKEKLELLIFGGEPLLAPQRIFALLAALSGCGLSKVEMISNAVKLTPELAAKLADAGVNRIQVTFDGSQQAHDAVRRDHRGSGTYDKIATNIALAQEACGITFSIRVNLTGENIGTIGDLLDDLSSRIDASRCDLHLAIVDGTQAGFEPEFRPDYEGQLLDWYSLARKHGFNVKPPVSVGDCAYCGTAGATGGAVINADGTLYSCWDSAGQDGYEVGHVRAGYYDDDRLAERWVSCGYQARHGPAPDGLARLGAEVLELLHGS